MIVKRLIGSAVVGIEAERDLRSQSEFLLDLVAASLAEGLKLEDGVRVEVGWSVLTLRQARDGEFVLYEPNFDGDPFTQLRSDLTTTLTVIAAQNDFLGASKSWVNQRDSIRRSHDAGALECKMCIWSDPATYLQTIQVGS